MSEARVDEKARAMASEAITISNMNREKISSIDKAVAVKLAEQAKDQEFLKSSFLELKGQAEVHNKMITNNTEVVSMVNNKVSLLAENQKAHEDAHNIQSGNAYDWKKFQTQQTIAIILFILGTIVNGLFIFFKG